MADASKLKGMRRAGLGAPPAPDEARTDLAPAPEPPAPEKEDRSGRGGAAPEQPPGRIDGRTLRRSGRTVQFATRVSPSFDDRVRRMAQREGLLLVEVLERALDAYEASSKKPSR